MEEFTKVRVKSTGRTGMVIDIYTTMDGEIRCFVDSDQEGIPGENGYDEDWDLYNFAIDEVEPI